jgi:hypothetical protein
MLWTRRARSFITSCQRRDYPWLCREGLWAFARAEFRAKVAAEPRSKAAFTIEPADDLVKLTVVHDWFKPGSTVLERVSAAGRS